MPARTTRSTKSTTPPKPASAAEYLGALTAEQRRVVERMLKTVREAAPEAAEVFSYGMPGFALDGRPLAWVAAWKKHYSMYPVSAAQVEAAARAGDVYEVEKGTVRFPASAAVPYALVRRIVEARAREIVAGGR